jgi:hypothetical protein
LGLGGATKSATQAYAETASTQARFFGGRIASMLNKETVFVARWQLSSTAAKAHG